MLLHHRQKHHKKGQPNCILWPDMFFYRDSHGNGVDVLIRQGNKFIPIEIKSSQTFSEEFLKGIRYFRQMIGADRCASGFVFYNGDKSFMLEDVRAVNPISPEGLKQMSALA